jgi:uncharacterized protein YuzE
MASVQWQDYVRLVPSLKALPGHAVHLQYDEEGDVLYVNFELGAAADESYEVADDVIGRFKDKRLIGYTVLNARHHGFSA